MPTLLTFKCTNGCFYIYHELPKGFLLTAPISNYPARLEDNVHHPLGREWLILLLQRSQRHHTELLHQQGSKYDEQRDEWVGRW